MQNRMKIKLNNAKLEHPVTFRFGPKVRFEVTFDTDGTAIVSRDVANKLLNPRLYPGMYSLVNEIPNSDESEKEKEEKPKAYGTLQETPFPGQKEEKPIQRKAKAGIVKPAETPKETEQEQTEFVKQII